MNEQRETLLLALADDELVMGHRLSEWTGWVPYVEEDLALSSIAQDEIGHARLLYELISDDVDALALGRLPEEYRHAVICERPNRDFAFTAARQYLYDAADAVRLRALTSTSDRPLAERIRVIRMEEHYHVEHARAWFRRLTGGPVEARRRYGEALAAAIPEAAAIFEPLPGEEALLASGLLPRASDDLLREWLGGVRADLESAGLDWVLESRPLADLVPTASGEAPSGDGSREGAEIPDPTVLGARGGRRSEDFRPLWEEMTGLYRAHRGARW